MRAAKSNVKWNQKAFGQWTKKGSARLILAFFLQEKQKGRLQEPALILATIVNRCYYLLLPLSFPISFPTIFSGLFIFFKFSLILNPNPVSAQGMTLAVCTSVTLCCLRP